MSEDFDVHFFREVEVTETLEAGGPGFVVEFEVVDGGVGGEEPAIEGVDDGFDAAALVDRVEEADEVVPSRIGDAAEGGESGGGPFEAVLGEQAAVFAEGDEDDAVEEFLLS